MSHHHWYIPLAIAAVLSAVVLGVGVWLLKHPSASVEPQHISEQDIATVKDQMEQSKKEIPESAKRYFTIEGKTFEAVELFDLPVDHSYQTIFVDETLDPELPYWFVIGEENGHFIQEIVLVGILEKNTLSLIREKEFIRSAGGWGSHLFPNPSKNVRVSFDSYHFEANFIIFYDLKELKHFLYVLPQGLQLTKRVSGLHATEAPPNVEYGEHTGWKSDDVFVIDLFSTIPVSDVTHQNPGSKTTFETDYGDPIETVEINVADLFAE